MCILGEGNGLVCLRVVGHGRLAVLGPVCLEALCIPWLVCSSPNMGCMTRQGCWTNELQACWSPHLTSALCEQCRHC